MFIGKVAAALLLAALSAEGLGAEKVVVRWQDLPAARMLQMEMRERG